MTTAQNKEGFIMTIILIVIALSLTQYVLHIDIIGYIRNSSIQTYIEDIRQISHDTWIAIKAMLTSTSSS